VPLEARLAAVPCRGHQASNVLNNSVRMNRVRPANRPLAYSIEGAAPSSSISLTHDGFFSCSPVQPQSLSISIYVERS